MSWCSGMVKEHVLSAICFSSLVFRVGCSRKQQAAQRNGDRIPAGENHENGRQRWRETPPRWHPDIRWEDRMGPSQRLTNERSQLKQLSISHHFEKFQTPWITRKSLLYPDLTNRDSLALIESCLCVVCLDEPCGLEPRDTTRALLMLHGGGREKNGANRWYDKSMQVGPLFESLHILHERRAFYLIPLLSVCRRNGRGMWGRVRAFGLRGNSSGAVLRIRDEIHVRQSLNIVVGSILMWQTVKGVLMLSRNRTGSPSKMARASVRELPPPRRLLWKCNPHIHGLIAASGDRLQRQDNQVKTLTPMFK